MKDIFDWRAIISAFAFAAASWWKRKQLLKLIKTKKEAIVPVDDAFEKKLELVQSPNVIVVEDSTGDTLLIQRAMKGLPQKIRFISSGKESLQYFSTFNGRTPSLQLILLDSKLEAGISGLDILKLIRSKKSLDCVPVVIFTGSSSEWETSEFYRNRANGCVTKPRDLEEFTRVLSIINSYWLSVNVL